MPELPEVETIATALARALVGLEIERIETFRPALRYPLEIAEDRSLLNSPVTIVRRRGRYIVIELANDRGLVIHLGMTGSLRLCAPETPRLKHEHVVFKLSDDRCLRYNDPRRFGFMVGVDIPAPGVDPEMLSGLGPEPLSDEFSPSYLAECFSKRRAAVKNAVMDNRVVVGVGNIYANEALYLSGINPAREVRGLSKREIGELTANIKLVLRESIATGGTTFSDYQDLDGNEGKYSLRLRVYGRGGQPCPECSSGIERRVIGGRSSFHCPRCQPKKKNR